MIRLRLLFLLLLGCFVSIPCVEAQELKQLWKMELGSDGREDQVCACGFAGNNVLVLRRSQDATGTNVVLAWSTADDQGAVTPLSKQNWPAEKACGGVFGYGVFPDSQAPQGSFTSIGRLVPDGLNVVQHFSANGEVEWTEEVPGGDFLLIQDAIRLDSGYLLSGMFGFRATCMAIDRVGQKRWAHTDEEKNFQATKAIKIGDDSIIVLNLPLAKRGKDMSPSLVCLSTKGAVVEKKVLGEIKKGSQSSILGSQPLVWLCGPFQGNQGMLAHFDSSGLRLRLFDESLVDVNSQPDDSAFADWAGIAEVGRLDSERFYVLGGSEGNIELAICSIDGKVLSSSKVVPPRNCFGGKVWTNGDNRLCLFLKTIDDSEATFLSGILYGFEITNK